MKKAKQLRLFDPAKVTSQQFEPVGHVQDSARSYAASQGLKFKLPNNQQQVDSVRSRAIAVAYQQAQARPGEAPGIRDSYGVFREHVNKQYEHMTAPIEKGGMGFSHEVTQADPYPDVKAAAADISKRKIKTFSTESTGGANFLTNEENDRFRAVHDVFGHAGSGRGFSRHGEEAAWQTHKSMFPPEAHAALTSELRGQNAMLNYGDVQDFPDQSPGTKLVGLPAWASSTKKFKVAPTKSRNGNRGEQGRLF